MRTAIFLLIASSTAHADVTVEPPIWQSTPSGILVPAPTQARIPGSFIVEAPGTVAAPPQYWKVVESQPLRSEAPRVSKDGGPSRPAIVPLPRQDRGVRQFRTTLSGIDVWVRIPALFLTLPDVKLALPDPLGNPGRPPVISTLNPPTTPPPGTPFSNHTSHRETPYERSMQQLYPNSVNSPAGWMQRRDQALSTPADQRTGTVQNLLRDAALGAKIRNSIQPRMYAVPRIFTQPDPATKLHELDPQLTQDDSLAGRQAREAARIDNLVGLERAQALVAHGDFASAREEIIAATNLNPEDVAAMQALTVLHLRASDDLAAAQSFGTLIRISPTYGSPDFSAWGLDSPRTSEAVSRLIIIARRNSGRAAADALMLAASIRASQSPRPDQVTQRLLNQALQAAPGESTESLALSLAAQWKLQTPARIGN